ncbi:uncharacterized protein CG4951 isoform X1 [Bactrocera dorsalis]|uniref:Uncharacterized protein CG4951 isoform X1 n=1 Tax=Bactrocera dorsalis TaxID=27457 RepID=A0ABM3K8J9_BACDO|nr:uncharacterized protein CG4951 isoform X1 [Bactrocera dorsalis]
MRILNSCILELREHKGRKFLCDLKFEKSSDERFNTEEQRDFRWLDRSDWKTFDAQLDKTISKLEKGVLEEKSFQLNDEIDVVVSISSTVVRTISKILGIECLEKKDYPVSLKCLFQRQSGRKTKVFFQIISANVCRDSEKIAKPDVNLKHLEDRDIFSNYSSDDISSSEKNLVKFKNVKLKSIDKEKTKKGPSVNIKASQDDNIGLKQFAIQRNNHRPQRTSARREKNSQVAIGKHEQSFNSYEESDDFIEEPSVKIGLKTQETLLKAKRQQSVKFDNFCCQENKSNSNWLTKKQPEELVVARKKSKITKSKVKAPRACAIITTTDTDSQHRQNEQIKANKKIKSFLEQVIQVPKEVKILTLNNMGGDEILKTFPKYKNQLDAVFNELRSKPKVSGYNGINHFSVIELIDNEKQLKIMHKLGEVYEKDGDGISMYPMLFANALMPEWLVNIFKDKYNFSYSEAVTHLNKQRLYMQYMDTDDHY